MQGWTPANFLMGAVDGALGNGQYTSAETSVALKSAYMAIYSQNDWQVTRNLTVDLGVRWDLQAPMTERYNRLSQFDLNSNNVTGTKGIYTYAGVNGNPRVQMNNDFKDFAPRIGFAYHLASKTVVRSAYGITYISTTGVGSGAGGFGTDGFSAPAFVKIRPSSGLDILQNVWNNAFSSGDVTAKSNP